MAAVTSSVTPIGLKRGPALPRIPGDNHHDGIEGDGRHQDKGIQVARARPIPHGGAIKIITPAEFRVVSQGMKLELDGGYTYSVTVTNLGPWSSPYEIVGTGV